MTEHLDELIYTNVARYVEGSTSLSTFEEWFIPATWNVERTSSPLVLDLIGEIKLRLAEYLNGHRTEAEFREHLIRLLQARPVMRR